MTYFMPKHFARAYPKGWIIQDVYITVQAYVIRHAVHSNPEAIVWVVYLVYVVYLAMLDVW